MGTTGKLNITVQSMFGNFTTLYMKGLYIFIVWNRVNESG